MLIGGYLTFTVLIYLIFGVLFMIGIRNEDYVSDLKKTMVRFSIPWGIIGLLALLGEIIALMLH